MCNPSQAVWFHLIGFKGSRFLYNGTPGEGMEWEQDVGGREGGREWVMYEERGEEGGDVEGEGPALHIPGLVGQQLVFVVPLERGGRRGGELAVEGRLLVPQHHLVLGGDHGPGEALICREGGRQTSV